MPNPVFIRAPYGVGANSPSVTSAPSRIQDHLHETTSDSRLPTRIPPTLTSDTVTEVLETLTPTITTALNDDDVFPVICGGDHAITFASLNALGADQTIGVVWIDAHADFNTKQSSQSGNTHGMVLAGAVGDIPTYPDWHVSTLREENIALVGTRNTDTEEHQRITDSEIAMFPANAIDSHGIRDVLESAIQIAGDGVDAIHVSIDIDVFDPEIAPGTGTPVSNGLTRAQAEIITDTLVTHITSDTPIQSLDIVEVDPDKDTDTQTVGLAATIIENIVNGIQHKPD